MKFFIVKENFMGPKDSTTLSLSKPYQKQEQAESEFGRLQYPFIIFYH